MKVRHPRHRVARPLVAMVLGICAALIGGQARAQGDAPAQITPPSVITHVDAVYPRAALATRKHADVVLALTVDIDGHVSKVDVIESGGKDLDEAAIVAARQWTFVPAERAGKPVASRIRVPFHFAPPAPPPELVPPTPAPEPELPTHGAVPEEQAQQAPRAPVAASEPAEVQITGKPNPPSRGPSDFRLSGETLAAAPHATGADLLSTAPGVFIAHPEGEAIAQRIYLRGFDAEHGQDVEFKVSGIPMNQPSHIHGQGYADLNLIIPETVRSIRVVEGVYDPRQGDFAVAGSIDYDLGVEERRSRVKATFGSFNTQRVLGIWAPEGEAQETFGAAVLRRTNGFGDGTRGATSGGAVGQYKIALPSDVTALLHIGAYAARANLAGVLRRDDIDAGRVGFYDAYSDPSARAQSAGTSRTQIGISLEKKTSDGARVEAGTWLYIATFRARTNFTGYTERSVVEPTWVGRGDLVEQSNDDLGIGGQISYRSQRFHAIENTSLQYELGASVQTHNIAQAQNLLMMPQNETWDQRVDANVKQTDIGTYADVDIAATRYVRVRGGARADLLFFDVDDKLGNFIPAFSEKTHIEGFRRTASGIAAGPRATVEALPAPWLKLSASYGEGYRSPDARTLEEGEQAPFAKVRSYEAGMTIKDKDRMSLTAAAYETDLSYDLAFDPTTARLERIGPTTRRGFVGYFVAKPAPWLNTAFSATYVHATLDSPPVPTPDNPTPAFVQGQALPYVPPLLVRADVGFAKKAGIVMGKELAWRVGYATTFLSARPLPYSQSSPAVFLVDATASVRRDFLELSLDVLNLLDAQYADTEYAFVSNWQTTPIPSRLPARHITAGAPRTILASITVYL
ncbi:MAG: TonB-dependent receptor [Polyangiaceae bacterium]|nr:TonB-dependent receptor [Polyangiaceae bacterium]